MVTCGVEKLILDTGNMKHLKTYQVFENSNIKAKIQDIPYETSEWKGVGNVVKKTGKTKVLDIAGRKIILIDINGVNCPFYLSTGHGGKKDVASGKWYPFFGIGSDGWFNKSSGLEINTYYGIELLKYYAQYLDKTYGDISKDDSYPKAAGLSKEGKTLSHISAINRDLIPTENELSNTRMNHEENIKQWKDKLKNAISK